MFLKKRQQMERGEFQIILSAVRAGIKHHTVIVNSSVYIGVTCCLSKILLQRTIITVSAENFVMSDIGAGWLYCVHSIFVLCIRFCYTAVSINKAVVFPVRTVCFTCFIKIIGSAVMKSVKSCIAAAKGISRDCQLR